MTLSKELQKAIFESADIIREDIEKLHSVPPTSKDYYAEYMSMLGKFEERDITFAALVMLRAGAKIQGIREAVNILTKK